VALFFKYGNITQPILEVSMKLDAAAKKIGKVMGEFKDKKLHSGKGGPIVKNPKQAIAIAISESKRMKKK
jgi:hypothetical protein